MGKQEGGRRTPPPPPLPRATGLCFTEMMPTPPVKHPDRVSLRTLRQINKSPGLKELEIEGDLFKTRHPSSGDSVQDLPQTLGPPAPLAPLEAGDSGNV